MPLPVPLVVLVLQVPLLLLVLPAASASGETGHDIDPSVAFPFLSIDPSILLFFSFIYVNY